VRQPQIYVQPRHQTKTMHVLMLLVSSKSGPLWWLASTAIHEADGRHGH